MSVTDWLLDSDPAVRWQVMRDLTHEPDETVSAERARVASEGWGARLLALQGSDGQWAGGSYFPVLDAEPVGQPWTATAWTLKLLVDLGIDPADERARRAVEAARASRWEYNDEPFFSGEVEPCINGLTVAIGSYFGEPVDGIVDLLLTQQLTDGGWNCDIDSGTTRSSFNSTIAVLEGLLAFGGTAEVVAARRRGEGYLLSRHLMRSLTTGDVPQTGWLQFSYPTRWYYDVLRGLDYFRAVGGVPDPRLRDAIALVESKRQPDGTWLLENTHIGDVHFEVDDGDGQPSRWNTLRALRVLRWWGA